MATDPLGHVERVVRVPVRPAARGEVEEVPDRREEVEPPLATVEFGVAGVAVADLTGRIAGEDAEARDLVALRILGVEVRVEGRAVAGEQAQPVPAAPPGPGPQLGQG